MVCSIQGHAGGEAGHLRGAGQAHAQHGAAAPALGAWPRHQLQPQGAAVLHHAAVLGVLQINHPKDVQRRCRCHGAAGLTQRARRVQCRPHQLLHCPAGRHRQRRGCLASRQARRGEPVPWDGRRRLLRLRQAAGAGLDLAVAPCAAGPRAGPRHTLFLCQALLHPAVHGSARGKGGEGLHPLALPFRRRLLEGDHAGAGVHREEGAVIRLQGDQGAVVNVCRSVLWEEGVRHLALPPGRRALGTCTPPPHRLSGLIVATAVIILFRRQRTPAICPPTTAVQAGARVVHVLQQLALQTLGLEHGLLRRREHRAGRVGGDIPKGFRAQPRVCSCHIVHGRRHFPLTRPLPALQLDRCALQLGHCGFALQGGDGHRLRGGEGQSQGKRLRGRLLCPLFRRCTRPGQLATVRRDCPPPSRDAVGQCLHCAREGGACPSLERQPRPRGGVTMHVGPGCADVAVASSVVPLLAALLVVCEREGDAASPRTRGN